MDYQVEQLINGPAGSTPLLDGPMKLLAGGAEVIFLAVVIAWFARGWWRRRRPDRFGAVAAVLGAAVALGVNQLVALLWNRPRPFVTHPSVHVLLSRSTDPSFPSDHVAAAFAIAGVMVLLNRRLGAAALLLAGLVAGARVYVGAHYPGDVLGGAVVGLIVAAATVWLLPIVPERLTDLGDEILRRLHLLPAPAAE